MRKPNVVTKWTEAMDAQLRAIWFSHSIVKCADILGLGVDKIRVRARRLGLPGRKTRAFRAHIAALWIAEVGRLSAEARVSAREVLAGVKRPELVQVRWLAWSNMISSGQCCSTSLLAHVAGFNHASVLYGVARHRRQSAKYLRTGPWCYRRQQISEAAE